MVKNLPTNAEKRQRFYLWVEKIPRSRKWQPVQVFLLREFQGQRILVGYSPCGGKELDMSVCVCVYSVTHTHTQMSERKKVKSLGHV